MAVTDMHSPVLMLAIGSGPFLLVNMQSSQGQPAQNQAELRCAADWGGLPFLFMLF